MPDARGTHRRPRRERVGLLDVLARDAAEDLHGDEPPEPAPALEKRAMHRRRRALPEEVEEAKAPPVADLDEIEARPYRRREQACRSLSRRATTGPRARACQNPGETRSLAPRRIRPDPSQPDPCKVTRRLGGNVRTCGPRRRAKESGRCSPRRPRPPTPPVRLREPARGLAARARLRETGATRSTTR